VPTALDNFIYFTQRWRAGLMNSAAPRLWCCLFVRRGSNKRARTRFCGARLHPVHGLDEVIELFITDW